MLHDLGRLNILNSKYSTDAEYQVDYQRDHLTDRQCVGNRTTRNILTVPPSTTAQYWKEEMGNSNLEHPKYPHEQPLFNGDIRRLGALTQATRRSSALARSEAALLESPAVQTGSPTTHATDSPRTRSGAASASRETRSDWSLLPQSRVQTGPSRAGRARGALGQQRAWY